MNFRGSEHCNALHSGGFPTRVLSREALQEELLLTASKPTNSKRACNRSIGRVPHALPSVLQLQAIATILLQAQECENLMRVVRELTASRSKLVAGKSVMAERFAELQAEYIKVLRIAELSRAASRSNLAKADKATNLAKQVR